MANVEEHDFIFYQAVRDLGGYVERTGAYKRNVCYPAGMSDDKFAQLRQLVNDYKKRYKISVSLEEKEKMTR